MLEQLYPHLQSALGVVVIVAIAWALSENRRAVAPRMILGGLAVQAGIGLVLLKFQPARDVLFGLNGVVNALTEATHAGTGFVFGFLGGGPPPFPVSNPGNLITLAFGVLPLIMVISALSALLWHWRILSLLVSAGLDSIAIRVPNHPVAQAILRAAGKPIAAPSANRSGAVSPTTPQHVLESLGDRVDGIVTGGKCMVGLESTVIDLTGPEAALLRPGAVLPDEMERLIGPGRLSAGDPTAPKSPGQLESHYAPNAAVRLNASSAEEDEAFLTFGPDRFVFGGTMRLNLSLEGDLNEAAANLFSHLRSLDQSGAKRIAVMPIPEVGLGLAINDRLRRAAAPRS